MVLARCWTHPLSFFLLRHSFLRNHVDPHPLSVQTLFLCEIHNIEPNCLTGFILNREVEPLVVASGVGVNPHIQVVLLVAFHRHHV